MMIDDIDLFVRVCKSNPDSAYEYFEFDCTDRLRDEIYDLADPESPEPFRSAMINLGFEDF